MKALEVQLAEAQSSALTASLTHRILKGLFQEWETEGPPGILDIRTLALSLEVSVDEVRKAGETLFTDGLVDRDRTQTALYLTPEGYNELYLKFGHRDDPRVPEPESYFWNLTPDRPALFRKLESEASGMDIPIVGPVVGELLHILVRFSGARRILELGTAIGYSTLYLATALPEGEGRVLTLEMDPAMARKAEQNLQRGGAADRVKVSVGDALTKLAALSTPFDLIFMDIEKADYLKALPHCQRLLRPSGLLVADNTAFKDADSFNRALAGDPGWRQINFLAHWAGHHPEQDGIALAVKL